MKVRLIHKTLATTALWVTLLMLLATPAFYWLTKEHYTDELTDLIEDVKKGKPLPSHHDIKDDIVEGVVVQFGIVLAVFAVGVVVSTVIISRKLWKPFNGTLEAIDTFRLEDGTVPTLPNSNIKEFTELNNSLTLLMSNNLKSYNIQKEFTENASHELQTPIAVIRTKLDQLIQSPSLTQSQAEIINEIYQQTSQMSKLSRNLLLLSKIENNQFQRTTPLNIEQVLEHVLSSLEPLLESVPHTVNIEQTNLQKTETVNDADDIRESNIDIKGNIISGNKDTINSEADAKVYGNPSLTESLISNLIVNAIRYTAGREPVEITLKDNRLTISNYSDSVPLQKDKLFNRFYRPDQQAKGNGLGLAIVKSICDYHHWHVDYDYVDKRHVFTLDFDPQNHRG